jgi:LacI family transcriptional regulator
VARGLRTNRSFTIGVIDCEARINPFHPEVVHAIQATALEYGYAVLSFNSTGNSLKEAMGVQRFLDQHVDGIIFYTALDPANVSAVIASGIPAVQVERPIARTGNVILIDPADGIDQAVDHLIALGHSRIAYIGGDLGTSVADDPSYESVEQTREMAFLDSLSRRGVPVPPGYIRRGPYSRDDRGAPQPGFEFMLDLISSDPRPTAVMCGSDVLAASALQAIAQAGLRVPSDISVIGFDDSIAELLTPPLCSIAQPVKELGRIAVEMIIKAINDPLTPPQRTTASTTFVRRASTAAVPDQETVIEYRDAPAATIGTRLGPQ